MRSQQAGDPDAGAIWGLLMGFIKGRCPERKQPQSFPPPVAKVRARMCLHFLEAAGMSVLIDVN